MLKTISARLLAMTLPLLCAMLSLSLVLSACGVRKVPLPAEDIEKPRYPPR